MDCFDICFYSCVDVFYGYVDIFNQEVFDEICFYWGDIVNVESGVVVIVVCMKICKLINF